MDVIEMNDSDRENLILFYIEANPGCNKSEVKKKMIAWSEKKTDKILKKLIEIDGKIKCYEIKYEIDQTNPRIHHLYINSEVARALKNLDPFMSAVKERVKQQTYTKAQLLNAEGEVVCMVCPNVYPSDNEPVGSLVRMAVGSRPFIVKQNGIT